MALLTGEQETVTFKWNTLVLGTCSSNENDREKHIATYAIFLICNNRQLHQAKLFLVLQISELLLPEAQNVLELFLLHTKFEIGFVLAMSCCGFFASCSCAVLECSSQTG